MKLYQMQRAMTSPAATQTDVDPKAGVLPCVWSTEGNLARAVQVMQAEQEEVFTTQERIAEPRVRREALAPEMAFYRSYTEGMLRRYAVLSMESGRVPSLLGKEMFRGRVTSYRVHAFDDVVIFVHDVDQCIKTLSKEQQRLIVRIGVQEYTFGEIAERLNCSIRSVQRHYAEALDELTAVFLERRLLERIAMATCQEGISSMQMVSHCLR